MLLRLAAVLLCLAATGCARIETDEAPPAAVPAVAAPAAGPTDLSVATDSLVDRSTPGLVVAVALPRIEGIAGAAAPDALRAANRGMRDSVEAFVRAVTPTEPPGEHDVTDLFETSGGFETTLFESDLYSGVVDVMSFAGGAHPNTFVLGLTVDLRTGAPVALADLFRAGAPFLDSLSAHVGRGVAAQYAERAGVDLAEARTIVAGYNPGGVHLSAPSWSLAPEGLVVHVPPYAVLSYAAGGYRVTVPSAALAGLWAAEGPAARLYAGR